MNVVSEYIKKSREVVKLWKERKGPTMEVEREFMISLHNLRKYLDEKGWYMPMPKYQFDIHNKKTWKYLDIVEKDKRYYNTLENPDFVFRN